MMVEALDLEFKQSRAQRYSLRGVRHHFAAGFDTISTMKPTRILLLTLSALISTALINTSSAQVLANQKTSTYRPITGQELLDGIMKGGLADWIEDEGQRTALSTSIAMGYIQGSIDSIRGKHACLNDGILLDNLYPRVLEYLSALPRQKLTENAAMLVMEAMVQHYPCRP
ncbi:Rap1a/Tai family immunity protein [Corticimicrobacter populi]|uniref:Rap1a immunity protein domain-containing protein n=1 Tax=Corticimicrobacter populi TaxID=2175229 RepID=A0A2V1JYB1_9BURK|nr:Rap1a/Tai family immunity protein [Corticimicrobacter populi]PWF20886.1 hypothetical protein DD235_16540 [Corticimicrobacter populi]